MASQSSQRHLVILGCGFMGTAILLGLLNKPEQEEGGQQWRYTACVRSEASLERLKRDLSGREGVTLLSGGGESLAKAAETADVVMLGCAPGDLGVMLGSAQGLTARLRKVQVISLLAGKSTQQLRRELLQSEKGQSEGLTPEEDEAVASNVAPAAFNLARVIPSIGAKIGDSVTLLAKPANHSDAEDEAQRLFSRVGAVLPVEEGLMDDATAVGAVCNALNILVVDAVTDASVAKGMDRAAASALAAHSLRSSSNLFCAGGMSPEELKTAMSTPKGITINSVLNLQAANIPAGVAGAVRAAIEYARSM